MISQLMFYPSWGKDLLNQFLEDARNFAPDSNIGGAQRAGYRTGLWNGIRSIARVNGAEDQNRARARIHPAR